MDPPLCQETNKVEGEDLKKKKRKNSIQACEKR